MIYMFKNVLSDGEKIDNDIIMTIINRNQRRYLNEKIIVRFIISYLMGYLLQI